MSRFESGLVEIRIGVQRGRSLEVLERQIVTTGPLVAFAEKGKGRSRARVALMGRFGQQRRFLKATFAEQIVGIPQRRFQRLSARGKQ